jgi:hypothetical protein
MFSPLKSRSQRVFARRVHGVVLAGCLFVFGPELGAANTDSTTVTITQRVPIEALSVSGDVTGVSMATVGSHYDFVCAVGNRLILQDAQGNHYRIAQASTDYIAPSPTPSLGGTTAAQSTTNTTPTSTPTPAPPSASSISTASPPAPTTSGIAPSDDAVATINKGLGKPFFTTQDFWKESSLLIANRLALKLEDKTKWEASYRRYFFGEKGNYDPAPILGGEAYCVALYADANDTPTSALIAFTNDGDFKDAVRISSDIFRLQHPVAAPDPDADKKIADLVARFQALKQSFEGIRQAEEDILTRNLTALFGEPRRTSFGSDAATRENALRWDWNDVSFLLTCQENKYNLLRIIPTALADNHGRTERIPRDEMGAKLSDAVEHRSNGDVVITQIPMADQGLKGYCVPATWERVLRYTGVPGDMYTLSRIGGAGFGGGEYGGNVASQLDSTLHNYGRRAEFITISKIDSVSLHRYIEKGIPVFWAVNPAGYEPSEQRYALVNRDKEWEAWKKLLEQTRLPSNPQPKPLKDDGGHQVLITGYNPETKEIAWSDPWGRATQERWMTEEEAQRCSLGEFYLITW